MILIVASLNELWRDAHALIWRMDELRSPFSLSLSLSLSLFHYLSLSSSFFPQSLPPPQKKYSSISLPLPPSHAPTYTHKFSTFWCPCTLFPIFSNVISFLPRIDLLAKLRICIFYREVRPSTHLKKKGIPGRLLFSVKISLGCHVLEK